MTTSDEADVTDRLAKALAAFQKAQKLVVTNRRKLRSIPQEEVDKFWAGTGAPLVQRQHACATEVMGAYRLFSAKGGIAVARDRRLVDEAYQVTVGDIDDFEARPRIDFEQRDAELQISRRLRLAIEAELERRKVSHRSEIAIFLGAPAREAQRLLRRKDWKEGDLALLQAAAARLGLTV